MSLRRRLTLASAAAVALAIVLASLVGFLVVRGELRGQIDDSLETLVSGIKVDPGAAVELGEAQGGALLGPGRTGAPPPGRFVDASKRVIPLPKSVIRRARKSGRDNVVVLPPPALGGARTLTQIVSARGRVSVPADTRTRLPVTGRVRAVAAGRSGSFFTDVELRGAHLRIYTAHVGGGYAIQAARSLDETDSSLRNLALILGGVALAGILLAVVLGLFVTRATLSPVERLSATAEEVARTRDLARRIEAGGSDELSRLARSFNTMLEALERSRRAQRQLVADASHELRTPLTSLRTNIEVLARSDRLPELDRQRLLADLTTQLEELGVLVGDLVELARDEERPVEIEELRLDLLAEEAIARTRRHYPGVEFTLSAEPCLIRAAPARVERAIANLLDNAAKWSPRGAPVEVEVNSGAIVVRDRGPGIADDDLPHVFDRFYRAPAARGTPGSGLGLAIVRQIAETAGGTVAAEPARGGGARLRLSFPELAAAEPAGAPVLAKT